MNGKEIRNNLKIVILSFAVIFWFRGMYRILDNYVENTMVNNIMLIIASIIIMLLIKGDLSPLGKDDDDDDDNVINTAASYIGMNGRGRVRT